MAKKYNSNNNYNAKKNTKIVEKKNTKVEEREEPKKVEQTFEMKVLVFLGVLISCAICIYLMNYFFVKKSYLKINISTDKRVDTIHVNGEDESIITQKYISDLNYSMRYDNSAFKVFKYKKQDMFKYNDAEKILVIVEQSVVPKNCVKKGAEVSNSCVILVDDFTKVYYVSEKGRSYKITVKTPGGSNYTEDVKSRINFMLNSFNII